MPIPSRENIHLPILKVLNDEPSGIMRLSEAVSKVMEFYPEITPEDLTRHLI